MNCCKHLYLQAVLTLLFFSLPCFSLTVGFSATDDDGPGKPFPVPRAESPIRVDAVLDEPAWNDALVLELPYETYPGENTPAPVKTECLITFSAGCLYVGFKAYDPNPEGIRAHLTDRDKCSSDDYVVVALDTFNDERRAFHFYVNPLGVQMDSLYAEVGYGGFAWDAIWDSAGRITSDGYVVEMAIPFNQLRFQRTAGNQVWGFEARRYYPRDRRTMIRTQKIDRDIATELRQYLKIEGFEGATPGRNIEINPTITASRKDARVGGITGDFAKQSSKADFGVTTTWGITPNMTFGFALNPDFSQVEADAAQLEINERFALYYSEKRPLFLESSDYFGGALNILHTRRIVDPSLALQFTGKEGRNTFGLILARDEATSMVFPGSQGSSSAFLDQESTAAAFSYRRDVGRNSAVSLMFTDRESGDYYNRAVSIGTNWRLTASDSILFGIAGSQTRYTKDLAETYQQPAESFTDYALRLEYSRQTRNWLLVAIYNDYGNNFRADLGYRPKVNYREFCGFGGYTLWGKPGDLYTKMQFLGELFRTEEHAGSLLEQYVKGVYRFYGPMQSSLHAEIIKCEEVYNGLSFKQWGRGISYSMRPSGSLYLRMYVDYSDGIDYVHAREGKSFYFSPYADVNLGNHFKVSFSHTLSRMTVEGGRLFLVNLPQTTMIYQFNTRAFFRAILQYRDIRQNPDLYAFPVNPVTRKLFTQLLFSYKLNPRTVLFVGYSDNHLGTNAFSLTQTDRTFFIKLGYAWVL